jgi:hypothetical protein
LEVEDMQSQPLKPFDFTDEETDSSSVKWKVSTRINILPALMCHDSYFCEIYFKTSFCFKESKINPMPITQIF